MNIILKEISRRNLFRYLGNAAIAMPFMRTLLETSAFGAVNRKRAVFYYYPNGIIPSEFHPQNTGSNFTLPNMSNPLARVQSEIIMLKKVNFAPNSNGHGPGMHYGMTGQRIEDGGVSIDTVLGNLLKEGTVQPVLRLGSSSTIGWDPTWERASFFEPKMASQIENNPTRSFQKCFGAAPVAVDNGSERGLSTAMKKSVIDGSLADLKRLQNALGATEKAKLDSHVASVREIERRLQVMNSEGGMSTSSQCTRKLKNTRVFSTNGGSEFMSTEAFNDVIDLNNEIAIQALACGITNVVYIQQSYTVSEMHFNNEGQPSGNGRSHHFYSHYNPRPAGHQDGEKGDTRAEMIKNQRYFMNKLADLITGLRDIKEGDQSLLYNTSLMAWSDLGDSAAHGNTDMGIVLAGQAGGYFKTGRCVDTQGADQTRVLVSIMKAFGSTAETFGNPAFGRGELSALKG